MTRREPRYATPDEVAQQAEEWPEHYLECRLYGHVWRPARATFHTTYRYYYVVQLCQRCACERHSELTERGHVAASWLVYADGYLTKNVGRIVGDGRDVLRLAALSRVYQVGKSRKVGDRPHSKATRQALGLGD